MIKDEIKNYTDKMNIKFAITNYVNIGKLAYSMARMIKKEFKENNSIQFDSEDIRCLIIAIDKTLKALYKKVDCWNFKKHLEKTYDKLTIPVLVDELTERRKIVNVIQNISATLCTLNALSVWLEVKESYDIQQKNKSDDLFNDSILEALMEAW
ncbi:MAG: hypothetical protein MJ180_00115 [Candidatus Gastranaerophilales bacterium]|nr:hypothetical protein [Candidatus Gastranaerophilales bacterium]